MVNLRPIKFESTTSKVPISLFAGTAKRVANSMAVYHTFREENKHLQVRQVLDNSYGIGSEICKINFGAGLGEANFVL